MTSVVLCVFCFKQKTAYEMRISDWSSDVCSSDLGPAALPPGTRIRVEQLFGKVPARRKFLRSARSEYAACADIVRRLAMARPDIGFPLEHDGRRNIAVQPGESRELRVAALKIGRAHV